MTIFNLPDLGEGLPDAEIVEWHVAEGDAVKTDDLLVSVETAKAVVEVPSPHTGVVARLYGAAGEVIATGAPLVEFGKSDSPEPETRRTTTEKAVGKDAATVVGNVQTGDELVAETAIAGSRRKRKKGRVKATPSVRTQARKLGIDLAEVVPTGKNCQVTPQDLKAHASKAKPVAREAVARPPRQAGSSDPLRGTRRAMAQSMSQNRDEVALCTIFDDADIHAWLNRRDFTARIMRAMVAGCFAEPGLNGFFDQESMVHQVEDRIDIAMAVDSGDGLIVPVIRNMQEKNLDEIREAVAAVKQATLPSPSAS